MSGLGAFPLEALRAALSGLLPGSSMPLSQAIETLMRVWLWVVMATTPYLVAVFGLWFWYQMARRAPSVIQRRAAESDLYEYDGPSMMPPVARPRGWLLPAAGLLLVVFSHPLYLMPGVTSPVLDATSIQIAAWVTAIGLFGWCLTATAAAEPRRPRFPTVEFLLPALVVPGAYISATRQWELLTAIVVLVGAILYVMYSERITRWIHAPTRRQRGLRAGAVGLLVGLGGGYAAGLLTGLGLGALAAGLFLFTAEWDARDQAADEPLGDAEQRDDSG